MLSKTFLHVIDKNIIYNLYFFLRVPGALTIFPVDHSPEQSLSLIKLKDII